MKQKPLMLLACALAMTGTAGALDFSNPASSTIIDRQELATATAAFGTAENNMNTRGVALLKGATPAQDRMVLWVEDEAPNPDQVFFITFDPNIANPTAGDLTVVGGDTLNNIFCEYIEPPYGTLSAGNGLISFMSNRDSGRFFTLDPTLTSAPASIAPVLTDRARGSRVGAINHVDGDIWITGATNDLAPELDGLVYLLDYSSAGDALLPTALSFTDVRDLDVIPGAVPGTFDALVADRANDSVHLVTDVLGAQVDAGDITPASIAGNVGIQGLVALDRNTYFLYDELPGPGFGDDTLIVVRNDAVVSTLSWNAIGAAGAGIGTNNLSVNFHNGIAARSVSDTEVNVHLTNFGAFGAEQVVAVVFFGPDAANIDYTTPFSQTIITQAELAAVTGEAPGDMNALGVAHDPISNRYCVWADGAGGNTYFMTWNATIFDPSETDLRLVGSASLETIYGAPQVPGYGTFQFKDRRIVWANNTSENWFALADSTVAPCTQRQLPIASEATVSNQSGAIDYVTDGKWLYGRTNVGGALGELGILDAEPGDATPFIVNSTHVGFTDIRDIAIVDGAGGKKDGLFIDRQGDTVNLVTDLLGTPTVVGDITPGSIAGSVGIQGLVALDRNLYFLYDELAQPNAGFGDDALIIVQNDAVAATYSWNQIGAAGAGLGTNELSVDFHNGLEVRQPNANTVEVYLSNFGQFSPAQIIKVTFFDPSGVDSWQQFD